MTCTVAEGIISTSSYAASKLGGLPKKGPMLILNFVFFFSGRQIRKGSSFLMTGMWDYQYYANNKRKIFPAEKPKPLLSYGILQCPKSETL